MVSNLKFEILNFPFFSGFFELEFLCFGLVDHSKDAFFDFSITANILHKEMHYF